MFCDILCSVLYTLLGEALADLLLLPGGSWEPQTAETNVFSRSPILVVGKSVRFLFVFCFFFFLLFF